MFVVSISMVVQDKFSRKDIDKLQDAAKHYGAKGLVWMRINEDEIASSVSKFY